MKKLLLSSITALLLAASPTYADVWGDVGKALSDLFEWLRWTETNWLGTVLVDIQPWDGAWPAGPQPTTVLQYEPGGEIGKHAQRWLALAGSGNDVEIRGPCFSACTLIVGYVPKDRLCFSNRASLQFHLAREPDGKPSMWASYWMFGHYPKDIRDWLTARGGVTSMTVGYFWELEADELWAMGYRKCKSSTILWLGAGDAIIVPNDAVSGPRDPRELKAPDPELLRRQRQQKDNEEVNREADRIRAEREADLAKGMHPPKPLGR